VSNLTPSTGGFHGHSAYTACGLH